MLETRMLDIGVWDRKKPLTKEQLKNRQTLFEQYQKEYNSNKSKEYFWEKLHPLIIDAVKSAIIRVNGQAGFIPNYQYKVDIADELLVKRYIEKPNYNFGSLSTLAYFAAIYASRQTQVIELDKEDSYDRIIEETLIRENEHVSSVSEYVSFYQDFDNYQDIDALY